MVPARGVLNGLDRPVASQKRRVLPSESFQTLVGRRRKTSITLRISLAIFRITLFSSSENESIEKILEREHHFYSSFSRGATLANEILKKNIELSTSHHPCPRPYSFCMKISSVRMQVLKQSSSHSMIHAVQH